MLWLQINEEEGLLLDLKNDLAVGQLPLFSFCLLTVNKSARQLFILFLICLANQFTPHSGIQLCHWPLFLLTSPGSENMK
jgi:hypothetical protein